MSSPKPCSDRQQRCVIKTHPLIHFNFTALHWHNRDASAAAIKCRAIQQKSSTWLNFCCNTFNVIWQGDALASHTLKLTWAVYFSCLPEVCQDERNNCCCDHFPELRNPSSLYLKPLSSVLYIYCMWIVFHRLTGTWNNMTNQHSPTCYFNAMLC